LTDLKPDRDNPGLRVCRKCNDQKDRYKLAPRQTEDITLPFVRPEVDLTISIDYLLAENGSLILTEIEEGLEIDVGSSIPTDSRQLSRADIGAADIAVVGNI
jgi:hypothetical protein